MLNKEDYDRAIGALTAQAKLFEGSYFDNHGMMLRARENIETAIKLKLLRDET